jgi:hypothetical protein
MSLISGILIFQLNGPTGRAKMCVDAKIRTLSQAHSKPNKLASHTSKFQKRASQFSLKINKKAR